MNLESRVSRFSPAGCLRLLVMILISLSDTLNSQTPSTGAVSGIARDPSGTALSGVQVHLNAKTGSEDRFAVSDENGWFVFLSLPPGRYQLHAFKSDFESLEVTEINVDVTETSRLELHFNLPTHVERVQVSSETLMTQLSTSALGRIVNRDAVTELPLVTRNFVQLSGFSPGVTVGVYNAGELGSGGTALSQVGMSNDGIFVHGSRSYANNWQLDGVSVSDILSSGSASGGVPTPNPDALEEFKVQTGQYDATFGRTSGANVSVITKTGTNQYHGTVFEFLRNDILNANDFFLNRTGQQRAALKQNQFGFALGGPIENSKLLFFGSYQGTRQVNGLAAGQARIGCSVSVSEPPITNDRSPMALGKLFGGMAGAEGGVSILPDGSNINPAALKLLNFKLPDGTFLIPTPQTVDDSKPFASSGFSTFTEPCDFREDQGIGNVDYVISQKNRLGARLFISDTDQFVTFPANGPNPVANTRGFNSPGDSHFIVVSIANVYAISNSLLNEARVGFVRTKTQSRAEAPFKWSDVGVLEGEMNGNNELPTLNIRGSVSMAPAFPRTYTQNTFSLSDTASWLRGAHSMKFGGSLTRLAEYFDIPGLASSIQFLSWPDFLLGLDASQNGTGTFSNVFGSTDFFGLFNRDCTGWEGALFAQDDYRIKRTLTVNLGLRYERLGHLGDQLGRNSSFDVSRANPNPPLLGSLDGYIVSSNFPAAVPPGVIRTNNSFGTYGEGQNTLAPRTGFAWQVLPRTNRVALRGGYGLYYSRPTGQASNQSILGAPFSLTRISTGLANADATFQAPFAQPFPTLNSFPLFVPYSTATKSSVNTLAPNLVPALVQQFSLNIQAEVHHGWLLETGYVGSRGTHLQRTRSQNQALDATPQNPIRGITSNTLDNIGSRVPVPGILPDSLREMESEGNSWYSGLEANLTKRLRHGFQLLGSYTFSKTLDTDGANINATSAGNTLPLGDQNSPRQRWGRASFDRTHRFVMNALWTLPSPGQHMTRAILGGWSLAAVVTIQSGTALTIGYTNLTNVFGINEDRAELSGRCSKSQLVKGGRIESKLGGYFNNSCFTTPPVIGADGKGTAFGNSATGVVDGPGQANLDVAVSKTVMLKWPAERSRLAFRAEFYNALNHPQFANPDTNFSPSSPTFGIISATSVSARVGQIALKLAF